MTTTKTYNLEFLHGEGLAGAAPDRVQVTITQEDVEKWLELARFIKAEGLFSIERFDNRCDFVSDREDHDDFGFSKIEFQPDFMRLQIQSDQFLFVGSENHSDDEWETSPLPLSKLADDFGLAF